MVITVQKGGVKKIKVEGEGDKGKEVIVRHGIVLPEWKTWNVRRFFTGPEQDLFHQAKEDRSKIRRRIMNIYVGNLSYDATDGSIREAFESFGQVTSAKVIKDKYSGQSRGFGFVEMTEQAQAQAAIKSLNGRELLGKQMSVKEAYARKDGGTTGGQRTGYTGYRNRY